MVVQLARHCEVKGPQPVGRLSLANHRLYRAVRSLVELPSGVIELHRQLLARRLQLRQERFSHISTW